MSARLNAMRASSKPVQSDAFSNDGKQAARRGPTPQSGIDQLFRGHEEFVGEGGCSKTGCFKKLGANRTGKYRLNNDACLGKLHLERAREIQNVLPWSRNSPRRRA